MSSQGAFHIVGKTSKGKTTAIRAGVSVWAKVIEGKGEMACSWSGTSNGLEMACKNHTNLPLFLDEIGRSEESKLNLESLLYTLGNGAGKARMSQDIKGRPIASWNLLALSTGEKTPRDVVQELGRDMATGADVRMAVIQAQPVNEELGVFETLPNDNDSETVVVRAKKLAERFAHYGAQYYGTA
ncbi:protein containing DUF927, partial [gut metagenome]